jgi:MFS transporter, ACS family, tartrate transporter
LPGCAVISTGAAWANVAAPLSKDLGRSATDIGLAAGIVFLGHIVVPIPGNLIQHRIGARTWITGILVACR